MLQICSQKLGGGYEGKPSIFDNISKDDLILAFFLAQDLKAVFLYGLEEKHNNRKIGIYFKN